jgi:AraC family transcriptional regulator
VVQPDASRVELLRPFAGLLDRPSHRHHAGIAGSAARLARELDCPDDLTSLAAEAGVLEMLVALGRLEPAVEQVPPPWLLRAQEVVHAKFREPLQIGVVAREVDVHPAHLARAFRQHFRMPLGSYVRCLRLDWAATRLAGSEESLASVAVAAGFADQSHLTRAFKRHTGHTPGAYRQARSRPT